jgi:hypothetical protein
MKIIIRIHLSLSLMFLPLTLPFSRLYCGKREQRDSREKPSELRFDYLYFKKKRIAINRLRSY